MSVKGYKAMNRDMTCQEFKFKIGETYTSDSISMCSKGFHFCENPFDVYNYYPKEVGTIICEIEALGEILKENDKSVTNKIKIVKRLTDLELLEIWIKQTNSGNRNSGSYNSGYYNSGNHNSGNRNSGDFNSGSHNSGSYNSGDLNSGDLNSGYYNSGDFNSGRHNSGSYNSGRHNSGNHNSGYLNSNTPKVRLFNRDSELKFDSPEIVRLLSLPVKPILSWVYSISMTEEEKINNPSHNTTGGFLRDAGRMSWDALTKEDFDFIKSLPNFDAEVFKTITGIDLSEPKTIKVMVEGKEFEVNIEKAKELGLLK